MKLARAAGIGYSQALERWRTAEDIAIEFAYERMLAEQSWERCQNCHVAPHEVVNERGRWLEEPAWKIELHTCPMCREVAELNDKLDEELRKAGAFYRIVPRAIGEPFIDDGTH